MPYNHCKSGNFRPWHALICPGRRSNFAVHNDDGTSERGSVTIRYETLEQLDDLLQRLSREPDGSD